METLSYCTGRDVVNAGSWWRAVWRRAVWICLGLAVVSGPWGVLAILSQGMLAEFVGRVRWQVVLGVAVAGQVGTLVLWMGMLLGLMRDERRLTDAEEAAIPVTLLVLVIWGMMDLLIAASCSMAEMGL